MRTRRFAVLLVFATLVGLTPATQAQTTLRFKFAKGQVNNYELVQEMNMSQNVGGGTEVTQIIETTQSVNEVLDDGSAKWTSKIARVKMSVKGLLGFTIDTADLKAAEGNPIAVQMVGVFNTVTKAEFTATQRPTGELLDFKVSEGPAKVGKLPRNVPMSDLFTEDHLKQMLSQGGIVLPKDAVAVGGSWTQKVSNKLSAGKMAGELKYTYRGTETVDGTTYQKITYTSNFTIDPDPNAVVLFKIKAQKGGGTILFDDALGRVHDHLLESSLTMSMTAANINQDQTVVQKMTMKPRK